MQGFKHLLSRENKSPSVVPLVRGWWTVAEIVGAELEGYRYEVSRDHV